MLDTFTADFLPLPDMTWLQWAMVLAIFGWSGFVRSGLGFGGAALGLPLLLLVEPDPLIWLPVIGQHLLLFSFLTLRHRWHKVDWGFIRRSAPWLIIPKIVGVLGLISLPVHWMATFVYTVSGLYALSWIFNRRLSARSAWQDRILLLTGGYISGTTLSGAPAIIPVYVRHVRRHRLRHTLFALWIVLVLIKLSSLIVFQVSTQLALMLITLPTTSAGHCIGLRFHLYMAKNDRRAKIVIGSALLLISATGMYGLYG